MGRLSWKLAAAAAAMLAAQAGTAVAEDRVVHVFNWSDYIDPEMLERFEAETKIDIVYDNYDNNEIVETRLMTGQSGFDVVVPTAPNIARQIQAGTLQKLDKSKLPNLVHMWPEITDRLAAYDPGNEYAVNYMWGTTGIGYNVDKIKERMPDAPVNSWDMIFNPDVVSKFANCGVTVLDTSEELIPAALNYLGLNPDSKDAADIDKAGDLLKSVRPHIRRFHSSDYIEALANGDICLAVGYSGDIFMAKSRAMDADRGVDIEYVIPQEGANIWFDSFVIPVGAPNLEEAYEFINFMLQPEVAAANSNYVFYANGNKDSQDFLSEDVIGDPMIYPGLETWEKLYVITPYDSRVQRKVNQVWDTVKSGD